MVSKAKIDAEAERLAGLAAVRRLKKIFPDRKFTACTYCGEWCMTTARTERWHPLCHQSHEDAVRAGNTNPPVVQAELSL